MPSSGIRRSIAPSHSDLDEAGSSVFAMAPHANPTFDFLVWLALRLANHLDGP